MRQGSTSVQEPLIQAPAVSELLGIKLGTVYKWASSGFLPSVRLGNKALRFDPEVLALWIQEHAEVSE